MSGISYTMPRFQAIDQNGNPMVGATLYTYQNKTTTPHPTWKDKDQTAYNTNPIVLDARGEAVIWLDPEQVYTFVLRDWFGVLVWSQDDIAGTASQIDLAAPDGASMVGFIQEGTGAVPRTMLEKGRELLSVEDFGEISDGDITDALDKALTAAKAINAGVVISPGEYTYSGNMIDIPLSKISFMCLTGRAVIECSGVTDTAAVNIYGGDLHPHPEDLYSNTTNRIYGIVFKGAQVSGKIGLLLGNEDYTYSGQCNIQNCAFIGFGTTVSCLSNFWRYKFDRCVFSGGLDHVFHVPSGVVNSGESITIDNSQIGGNQILIEAGGIYIGMTGTSVLNAPIKITGMASKVFVGTGCNLENPGDGGSAYKYVEATGREATFVMDSATLILNKDSLWNIKPFKVTGSAHLIFNAVNFPAHNYSGMEAEDGVRSFVTGDGYVSCSNCTLDYQSGSSSQVIHESINTIFDSGFESNDLSQWTINKSSDPTQSAVISAAAKKNGDYGLRITSNPGHGIDAYYGFPVKPGATYIGSVWARMNIAPTTGAAGYIQLRFYNREGGVLIRTALAEVTSSAWQVRPVYPAGVVPPGANFCRVYLSASQGAEIDYDDVVVNFI